MTSFVKIDSFIEQTLKSDQLEVGKLVTEGPNSITNFYRMLHKSFKLIIFPTHAYS